MLLLIEQTCFWFFQIHDTKPRRFVWHVAEEYCQCHEFSVMPVMITMLGFSRDPPLWPARAYSFMISEPTLPHSNLNPRCRTRGRFSLWFLFGVVYLFLQTTASFEIHATQPQPVLWRLSAGLLGADWQILEMAGIPSMQTKCSRVWKQLLCENEISDITNKHAALKRRTRPTMSTLEA